MRKKEKIMNSKTKTDQNWDSLAAFLAWLNEQPKPTRKVGDEILANGFWMTIVEIIDEDSVWAMDQDGQEHEINLN